jgi:hypothetical protein
MGSKVGAGDGAMTRSTHFSVAGKSVFVERIPVRGIRIQKAFRDGDMVVLHISDNRVAVLREAGPKMGFSYPLRPLTCQWQRAILGILHTIGIASKADIDKEVARRSKEQAEDKRKWDQESLNQLAKQYGFKAPKLKVPI